MQQYNWIHSSLKNSLHVNEHNEKLRLVVIHLAVLCSIDRFLGILIKHFAGAFPLWLAPKQVEIIGISSVHEPYVEQVYERLRQAGIRASVDRRPEKLGKKIREAQLKKVPYILVLGNQEQENGTVTVRSFRQENLETMTLEDFILTVKKEVEEKALPMHEAFQ